MTTEELKERLEESRKDCAERAARVKELEKTVDKVAEGLKKQRNIEDQKRLEAISDPNWVNNEENMSTEDLHRRLTALEV